MSLRLTIECEERDGTVELAIGSKDGLIPSETICIAIGLSFLSRVDVPTCCRASYEEALSLIHHLANHPKEHSGQRLN